MRALLGVLACAVLVPPCGLRGGDLYVSPAGSDANSGRSPGAPLRTLAQAVRSLMPGDTCWLRGGIYREQVKLPRSGRPGAPITLAAYRGEQAILDGCDPVAGPWKRESGGIWSARVEPPVAQVFCDDQPMTQARWPNCAWPANWLNEQKWARTGPGTSLGEIRSAELARAGIDLSGGIVFLKLSKGNSCYARPILSHQPGAAAFRWDARGLPGRIWREDGLPERIAKFGLVGNRFYVVAPGALDAPSEWWHDSGRRELRLIAPDGGDPGRHRIEVQVRSSALAEHGLSDLTLRGLEFQGCNVDLTDCRRVRLENCRFFYPEPPEAIPAQASEKSGYHPVHLRGEDLSIVRCEIAGAFGPGLAVEGSAIRVEDCVVHDANWNGSHPGPAISLFGIAPQDGSPMRPNVVRGCTCYRFGGVGIYAYGEGPAFIDHNHLFDGGLYCTDDSSLYIPTGERMAGSVVDHNWIESQHGIGFRVDQWGRGIDFHHNLVWDTLAGCKLEGLALTADHNTVLANDAATNFPFVVVFDRSATPAELQAWRLRDNVAVSFVDRNALRPSEAVPNRPFVRPLAEKPPRIENNVAVGRGPWTAVFVDPAHHDFRPRVPGPLAGPAGAAGALDAGIPPWTAGSDWLPEGRTSPRTPADATRLAAALRPEPLKNYGPAQQ